MRLLARIAVICLLPAAISPGRTVAAEYDDADILPGVTHLTFARNDIGLRINHAFFAGSDAPALLVDRRNHSMRVVSQTEHDAVLGAVSKALAEATPNTSSNGTAYTPAHCDGWSGHTYSKLVVDGKRLDIDIGDCVSVSEAEIVEDTIWLGTYYEGGHGNWGSQGLLAVSISSGKIVSQIDTGDREVLRVRRDPYSGNVWAITPDQIVVANRKFETVRRYSLYYDFNATSGMPEIRVADEPTESHPLAVFSFSIPDYLRSKFFNDVQSIPDDRARRFSLYDFFMCCHFLQAGDKSPLPVELEILVPYLLPAFEKSLSKYDQYPHLKDSDTATRPWRQVACWFRRNEAAESLCETEDWRVLVSEQIRDRS